MSDEPNEVTRPTNLAAQASADERYCKSRSADGAWCTAAVGHAGDFHVVHHLDGTPNVWWAMSRLSGETP